MSIFASDDIKEFEYEGHKFGIKEISYGQSIQINKKALNMNLITKQPEMDLAILQEEKLKHCLAYIKDKNNKEVPVTLDTIRKLKEEVAQKIMEQIDVLNDVGDDEKKI